MGIAYVRCGGMARFLCLVCAGEPIRGVPDLTKIEPTQKTVVFGSERNCEDLSPGQLYEFGLYSEGGYGWLRLPDKIRDEHGNVESLGYQSTLPAHASCWMSSDGYLHYKFPLPSGSISTTVAGATVEGGPFIDPYISVVLSGGGSQDTTEKVGPNGGSPDQATQEQASVPPEPSEPVTMVDAAGICDQTMLPDTIFVSKPTTGLDIPQTIRPVEQVGPGNSRFFGIVINDAHFVSLPEGMRWATEKKKEGLHITGVSWKQESDSQGVLWVGRPIQDSDFTLNLLDVVVGSDGKISMTQYRVSSDKSPQIVGDNSKPNIGDLDTHQVGMIADQVRTAVAGQSETVSPYPVRQEDRYWRPLFNDEKPVPDYPFAGTPPRISPVCRASILRRMREQAIEVANVAAWRTYDQPTEETSE